MNRPPLDIDAFDRNAERRHDPDWLDDAWQRARIVVCDSQAERIDADDDGLRYYDAATAPDGERIYLGGEDQPVFAVLASVPDGLPNRWIGAHWDQHDLAIAVQAIAMGHWRAAYRYHPTTGEPLTAARAGWELTGPVGRAVFPRTDPAVIVLIDDGADRVLLARHHRYGGTNRYACIAGFVEPGESAEAAVHREVHEETNLKLDRLAYVASQPWPYPRSLMLAYRASADPGQTLRLQADEIADARWFDRDEVRRMWIETDAETPSAVRVSVARFLIEGWLGDV